MEIITVKDLTKTFTYSVKEKGLRGSLHNLFARPTLQKTAVNGVSFSIEKGEAVGLLGPNGAGKTTTLKMLSGILYPTAGTATVAGFVPWERRRDYQRRFAIVMGQKTQLWPDLPALDTFELNRRIYDLDPREYQRTLDELTDLLGVGSLLQVQVRRLSLGELNFSIFYTVALLGFWLTEIRQLFGTISLGIMVVSGGVFPLDIFGPAAAAAVQVLPFGYTTQFCVNIVNGRLAPGQIGRGFAVQWAWVAGFTLLYRLLWRRGARRYTAVGG